MRRLDPERRDRIIAAATDSIAQEGVSGTSHRKVAVRADVPLGSMTYHFSSMDDLLTEVFTAFAATISTEFEARMAAAETPAAALDQIVDLIHSDLQRSKREHVLTYELYTLAARRADFRSITEQWMQASRAALERHFEPDVARALDAYIEGTALHIALDTRPQNRELTRAALHALTNSSSIHERSKIAS
ncbi:TetR/AcrR family transcriptional regulator [Curtobacterium sp. 20TX0008]|uniref:TetR/AcrR family transcriptional regulator n=1 Tax=Curtobacterium sp. 20TX0008 TaxID=3022018 RepID=UPI0023310206|nr:TetR family transcriptional regulator [Curtobacterium sp. 20TX0008]MDB6427109.1 TetR family transcriptional regulator [Curtobacterium sp. 20TX0008]